MPSIGTSNTTLTLAAMSFMTAEHIATELTTRPTVTIGG
jgi:hypothetical protein